MTIIPVKVSINHLYNLPVIQVKRRMVVDSQGGLINSNIPVISENKGYYFDLLTCGS